MAIMQNLRLQNSNPKTTGRRNSDSVHYLLNSLWFERHPLALSYRLYPLSVTSFSRIFW